MELRALREHGSSVAGLLALNDGRLLSWARSSSTLRIWNAAGDLLHDLESSNEAEGALELRDGRLLSWTWDRKIRLWSTDGDLLHTTEKHHGSVSSVLELNDGRFVSWARDPTPRLWSSDGRLLRTLKAHGGQVYGVIELQDGRLLSWASHGWPRLWSSNGDLLRNLKDWGDNFLKVKDGRLACWRSADNLRVLSVEDERHSLLPHVPGVSKVRGRIELKDGRLLSWSQVSGFWTFVDGSQIGQWVRVGTLDLCLWSGDGIVLNRLNGHLGLVNGALELKNDRLLSWSEDGTLRLWSRDGSPLGTLGEHSSKVVNAFKLSDDRFVSWTWDGVLQLWNDQGKLLATLEGEARILNCAVLQDGQTIVAGNTQGHLMFIQLPIANS